MLTYCYICVVYESCWKSRKWRIKLFKKKYLNDSLLLSFQCFQIHLHTYLVGCKSFRESDVFSMSYLFFLWQWTIFQFLSLSLSLCLLPLFFNELYIYYIFISSFFLSLIGALKGFKYGVGRHEKAALREWIINYFYIKNLSRFIKRVLPPSLETILVAASSSYKWFEVS